ncbi:uncharacterized protein T551_00065 [Pneumocystis jirovecii RU7]|uniref:MYND-type domain-containing protein n=2 Tax=Pneumocystis jirovecii TaxID=42068 RepID=A0A0W4ZW37_PNEJ7|nr:uncharacterized protein T551_00065 [Pneumocystis jirovecii RU7]KTW32580.1 hypothetical protein T551_00065 [Pneumocystis jirovecii RU7]
MRESNFCSPSQNRAAVAITSALYDRRALDCTATLPLVNSLSHLSFLTSTSSRIREILAEDEGLERLIRILQEGRKSGRLEAWKWQLAFQCVVNIGIRGSEKIRTRVVEADMVPVIATVLDGFLHRVDLVREAPGREGSSRGGIGRQLQVSATTGTEGVPDDLFVEGAFEALEAPLGINTGGSQEEINAGELVVGGSIGIEGGFSSEDIHVSGIEIETEREEQNNEWQRERRQRIVIENIRQQSGILGGDSDDTNSDDVGSTNRMRLQPLQHPSVEFQILQDSVLSFEPEISERGSVSVTLETTVDSHDQTSEAIEEQSTLLSHEYSFHSIENGAFSNTIEQHNENEMHLSNVIHENHEFTAPPSSQTPSQPTSLDSRHFFFKNEDNVVFCLQLLAYISKYPQLRSYFQNSHDIPELRYYRAGNANDNKAIPINVFSLVERFTLRIHPTEIQYWAGVIMRNTCRKDESKGGIRQCAYIDCGRWETFNRQFAKCRRCRRTKYCSKQCQSRAWPGHRWWCRERSTN